MKKSDWLDDEVHIVSVNPVPFGLAGPVLSFAAFVALLVAGYESFGLVRQHIFPVALVVLGPTALVIATRTWRWQSHRVTVTSHRIVISRGTIRRRDECGEAQNRSR